MLHEGTMHCVHLLFCFFPTAPASQHRMQPAAGWLVVQLLASSPVLCQNHLATWQLTWISFLCFVNIRRNVKVKQTNNHQGNTLHKYVSTTFGDDIHRSSWLWFGYPPKKTKMSHRKIDACKTTPLRTRNKLCPNNVILVNLYIMKILAPDPNIHVDHKQVTIRHRVFPLNRNSKTIARACLKMEACSNLVGGWTNPFGNIGSFPQFSGWKFRKKYLSCHLEIQWMVQWFMKLRNRQILELWRKHQLFCPHDFSATFVWFKIRNFSQLFLVLQKKIRFISKVDPFYIESSNVNRWHYLVLRKRYRESSQVAGKQLFQPQSMKPYCSGWSCIASSDCLKPEECLGRCCWGLTHPWDQQTCF